MKRIYFNLMFFVFLLSSLNAKSQGGNNCTNAVLVSANTEMPQAQITSSTPEQWFKFTAQAGNDYFIINCSENTINDTEVFLYDGSCPDDLLISISYGYDNCYPAGAFVKFTASLTGTYYILWKVYENSGTGNFDWKLTSSHVNTRCSKAIAIALNDEIDINHTKDTEIWYTFTASENANYYLPNIPNSIEVSVYTNCKYENEVTVSNGNSFSLVNGQTYYISLYNPYKNKYSYTLNLVKAEESVICTAGKPIYENTLYTSNFTNTNSLWYVFTPTTSGVYKVEGNASKIYLSCNSTDYIVPDYEHFVVEANQSYYIVQEKGSEDVVNWKITPVTSDNRFCSYASEANLNTEYTNSERSMYYWYTFTPANSGVYMIENPDNNEVVVFENCHSANALSIEEYSKIPVTLTAHETYYIRFRDNVVNSNWKITEDNCTSAVTVTINQLNSQNNTTAWYTFTPQTTGFYTLSGTGLKTIIFKGSDCNNKTETSTSQSFFAEAEETYYFLVSGNNWTLTGIVEGLSCQEAKTAILSEYLWEEEYFTENVWYTFTATETAVYTIRHFVNTPNYYVYTGNCNNLTPVEVNSDNRFLVQEGATYYIKWKYQGENYLWRISRFVSLSLNINVNGKTPAYNQNTSTYSITLPKKENSVTIVAENARATVTGNISNVSIAEGETKNFTITVTDEDNSLSKTYTVNVTRLNREADNNATLDDLKINGLTIAAFSPTTYTYGPELLAYSTTNITLAATSASEATIVGTGTKGLAIGNNVFTILVTAEDGITTQTYTVDLYRKNNNVELSGLTVNSQTPVYDEGTNTYSINIPQSESTVTIAAVAKDAKASLTGVVINIAINEDETKTFTITVSAEDNTIVKTYSINVTRLNREIDNNANLSDLEVNGSTISGFTPTTYEYTYKTQLPYSVNTIGVDATTSSAYASVVGIGSKTLSVGNNAFTIVVTAEDSTKQIYIVNVYRKNNDATLSNVSVNGKTAIYDEGTHTYSITIPDNESTFTIQAITTDPKATVNNAVSNQNINLNETQTVNLLVTPEDNSILWKVYPVIVTRDNRDTDDALLTGIKIDATSISSFDPNTFSYSISSSYATSVMLDATTSSIYATVTGIGERELKVGYNNFEIKVTAESGYTKTYTVQIYCKNNNVALSRVGVNNGGANYNESTSTYTATIFNNENKYSIYPFVEDYYNANAYGGVTNVPIEIGETKNNIITVVADDPSYFKKYTVIVTRINRVANNDTKLTDLKVNGTSIEGFAPTTYEYTYGTLLPYNTNTISLDATSGSYPSIEGTGVRNLVVGNNALNIKVYAENRTANQTYTVNVYRKSNNVSLSKVIVNNKTFTYDEGTSTYHINIPENETTITIAAITTDINASIITGDVSNIAIAKGETKQFTLTVTAEDNTITKTYNVNVTRLNRVANSDAKLSSLKVNGITISGFNPTTYTYNYSSQLPYNTNSVTFSATTSSSDAIIVSGVGVRNLELGNNALTIVVTAEDGITTQTYTINVYRRNKDASLNSVTVNGKTSTHNGYIIYSITIPQNENTVTIVAAANDAKATVTGNVSNIAIAEGETKQFPVTVKAEDNTSIIYTVKVTRSDRAADNNAKLTNLKVNGVTIAGFNSTTYEYTYTAQLPYTTASVNLAATISSSYATVSGTGAQNLAVGNNALKVVVTAEDGTKQTYTVNVYRKNNNVVFSSVSINSKAPVYNESTSTYSITIPQTENTVTIVATAADTKAIVTGNISNTAIAEGETKDFTLSITAEDNAIIKTYTVRVTRSGKLSNNTLLQKVTVDSAEAIFDGNSTYSITIESHIESVIINATPVHASAQVTVGNGSTNLNVGHNNATITVRAEDGTTKNYILVIKRKNVGIADVQNKHIFVLFPNPVTKKLFIQTEEVIKNIVIFDMNGKQVKQLSNIKDFISVIDLAKGTYLIKIHTKDNVSIQRFIKQ